MLRLTAVQGLIILTLSGCQQRKPGGDCGGGTLHGGQPPDGFLQWCADDAGRKQGRFREWWPDGTPKLETTYRNGKVHGSFASFHQNGKRKEQGEYADGLRVGRWQEWADTGNLRRQSEHLAGGEVRFTAFHENGQRWVEGATLRQRQHGHFTEWSPEGKKIAEGDYAGGEMQDNWQFWNDDGTPSDAPRGMLVTGGMEPEEE